MRRTVSIANQWPSFALDIMNDALNAAESLTFSVEFQNLKTQHYFGRLSAVNSSGEYIDIGSKLVAAAAAIVSTDFPKGMLCCE